MEKKNFLSSRATSCTACISKYVAWGQRSPKSCYGYGRCCQLFLHMLLSFPFGRYLPVAPPTFTTSLRPSSYPYALTTSVYPFIPLGFAASAWLCIPACLHLSFCLFICRRVFSDFQSPLGYPCCIFRDAMTCKSPV